LVTLPSKFMVTGPEGSVEGRAVALGQVADLAVLEPEHQRSHDSRFYIHIGRAHGRARTNLGRAARRDLVTGGLPGPSGALRAARSPSDRLRILRFSSQSTSARTCVSSFSMSARICESRPVARPRLVRARPNVCMGTSNMYIQSCMGTSNMYINLVALGQVADLAVLRPEHQRSHVCLLLQHPRPHLFRGGLVFEAHRLFYHSA